MNGPVISLTVAYVLLGLLLISLNMRSDWPWPVKAIAIVTAVPLFMTTFVSLQALLGWPSASDLPEQFQLHAALVEEPSTGDDRAGAIFLWLTPAGKVMDEAVGPEVSLLPRAFALPYSRDLHSRVEAMRDALQKGDLVAGRHKQGSPWARRFGQQDGGVDLFTPPPPPMPSKDS